MSHNQTWEHVDSRIANKIQTKIPNSRLGWPDFLEEGFFKLRTPIDQMGWSIWLEEHLFRSKSGKYATIEALRIYRDAGKNSGGLFKVQKGHSYVLQNAGGFLFDTDSPEALEEYPFELFPNENTMRGVLTDLEQVLSFRLIKAEEASKLFNIT